jgi:hypothetical protein
MIRISPRFVVLMLAAALALLLAPACGGSSNGDEEFPSVITLGKGELFPSITNQVLAAGENRLTMSLMDRDDNKVLGATVHLSFYDLNEEKPRHGRGGRASSRSSCRTSTSSRTMRRA